MLSVVVLVLLAAGGVVVLNLHPRNTADTTATPPTGTPDGTPASAPDSGSDSASDGPSDSTPDSASDDPSGSASSGDYQQPPDCSQLNNGSITFQATEPVTDTGYSLDEECGGTSPDGDPAPHVILRIYTIPDGAGEAATSANGFPISGTDFENSPTWGYLDGQCFISYSRSNEFVKLAITGTTTTNCKDVGLQVAQQYYPLIG